MPEIPAEYSPWGEPDWRERALAWVHAQVRAQGVTVLGVDEPSLRAWSIILRLRTSRGPVWFKANPPGSRFEITREQYAALSSAGPRQLDWCTQLAASSVPPTLDHSDLHEGQAFVGDDGRFVFFDWGDAAIAHPFASLLVVYRVAAQRLPNCEPRPISRCDSARSRGR